MTHVLIGPAEPGASTVVMMGEVWQLMVASSVIGAGIGLAYGAMPALVMGAVPVSETAAANSLNTLMRGAAAALLALAVASFLPGRRPANVMTPPPVVTTLRMT